MSDKGKNTLILELEETREELANTLDDIFATFNPLVQIRSHQATFAVVFLAAVGGMVALLAQRLTRGH